MRNEVLGEISVDVVPPNLQDNVYDINENDNVYCLYYRKIDGNYILNIGKNVSVDGEWLGDINVGIPKQTKSVTYNSPGTNTIIPDSGYSCLSSVEVTVGNQINNANVNLDNVITENAIYNIPDDKTGWNSFQVSIPIETSKDFNVPGSINDESNYEIVPSNNYNSMKKVNVGVRRLNIGVEIGNPEVSDNYEFSEDYTIKSENENDQISDDTYEVYNVKLKDNNVYCGFNEVRILGKIEYLNINENGTYYPSDFSSIIRKVVVNTPVINNEDVNINNNNVITSNGIYSRSSGYTGWNDFVVNVPKTPTETTSVSYSLPGNYTVTPPTEGYNLSRVDVNVTNQVNNYNQPKITKNGIYNIPTGYSGLGSVQVEVSNIINLNKLMYTTVNFTIDSNTAPTNKNYKYMNLSGFQKYSGTYNLELSSGSFVVYFLKFPNYTEFNFKYNKDSSAITVSIQGGYRIYSASGGYRYFGLVDDNNYIFSKIDLNIVRPEYKFIISNKFISINM